MRSNRIVGCSLGVHAYVHSTFLFGFDQTPELFAFLYLVINEVEADR